jgi:hypothetical protein
MSESPDQLAQPDQPDQANMPQPVPPEHTEPQLATTNTADGSYAETIRAANANPAQLERLYQSARRSHQTPQFTSAMLACAAAAPENLLYAAWYYRLQQPAQGDEPARHPVDWRLAVQVSVVLLLAFWALSDTSWQMANHAPYLVLFWAPLTAIALISFVTIGARARGAALRAVLMCLAVAAITAYVLFAASLRPVATQKSYLDLMLAHVPLLAWGALGIAVLGWRSSTLNRFAFLNKSIETVGTAGVYSIAGGIFFGLTYTLFGAIGVEFPDIIMRLFVAAGLGLIPVFAVASVYDPQLSPAAQDFRRGFGRILTILMQVLLPLTLIVLVVYLCLIPFNFAQPFTNRNVLIVYNVGLFGVMGLLLGVTPVRAGDFSERHQRALRAGIIAVAALATLVSLYALAAIVYRTAQGALTMNRLVVIGWNAINITLLLILLVKQARAQRDAWVEALQAVVRIGIVAYLVWGAFLLLALPWLF